MSVLRRMPFALALASAAMLATPASAAPYDMSVGTFLEKVAALKAKGAMALFSGDMKLLRGAAQSAGETYAARLRGERAAGHPSSCPSPGAKPSQDQWLSHLSSYPAPVRPHTTLLTAMADWYRKTYPCR